MERSGTPALALLSAVPVMTKERFAELVGVEVGVVRGMLDRGYLPSMKIGRHRLINMAALQARCLAEDSESGFLVKEEPASYGRCQVWTLGFAVLTPTCAAAADGSRFRSTGTLFAWR